MKKLYLLLTVCIVPLLGTYAQQAAPTQEPASTHTSTEQKLAPEGTFLLIPKSKMVEVFTIQQMVEIRAMVEANRKEDVEHTIYLSIYNDLLILPKKTIEDPKFRPFLSLYE